MLTPKTQAIRVLLVDDHEVVRVGLRTVLGQSQGVTVVGEAGTMAEAIQQAQRLKPDVILMDVRLPDGPVSMPVARFSGRCRGHGSFSSRLFADDDSILAAVLAGAHGYVLKEIDSPALLEATRSVANGQSVLDSGVTERALRWLRGIHELPAAPGDGSTVLSGRTSRGAGCRGKTNKEIAVALGLSDKTVKNYLANVFQKLRITRRAQAAAFFVKRKG